MLIQWKLSRADTFGTRKGVRNWTHSIGMALFTDSEFRATFLSSVNNIIRRFYQYFNCLNNYWTRLSKIWWFVSGEQIIIDLRENTAIIGFDNCSIIRSPSLFFNKYLPFSRKSNRKKEKSAVLFAYEQKIICSQTQLNDIAHEQTIICRQLSAGHLVGSRPMKRKNNLREMIIAVITNLRISPANMAIVALEGHEVRILHTDSWRCCVGVTRYFNTDFEFENFRLLLL